MNVLVASTPIEAYFFLVDEEFALDTESIEDLACYDASCRPPTSGGTGGSSPKGGGKAKAGGVGAPAAPSSTHYGPKGNYVGKNEHASDVAVVSGKNSGAVRSDGILSEDWLDDQGNVVLTAKQEATARKALEQMDTSYEEWVGNVQGIAAKSMNANPEQALKDSKWYTHENETWGTPLAKEHGITIDQVMGIAAATSTNKAWDGVKSNNKEVVETILGYLKENKQITITPEQAAAYNKFSIDKPSGGGKYGPKTIEPGEYRMSDLSSGTLARVMGSGYNIGGQYFTDGLFKAFSIARGELEPNAAIGSLKQRSFSNNLTRPTTDYSSTNDFWMARALFGIDKTLNITTKGGTGPTTMRDWERSTNQQANTFFGTRGTGDKSLFALATKASKEALANLQSTDPRFKGMLTHEFQALVWVQMQREYLDRGWN